MDLKTSISRETRHGMRNSARASSVRVPQNDAERAGCACAAKRTPPPYLGLVVAREHPRAPPVKVMVRRWPRSSAARRGCRRIKATRGLGAGQRRRRGAEAAVPDGERRDAMVCPLFFFVPLSRSEEAAARVGELGGHDGASSFFVPLSRSEAAARVGELGDEVTVRERHGLEQRALQVVQCSVV
jgi:hypothetical protein